MILLMCKIKFSSVRYKGAYVSCACCNAFSLTSKACAWPGAQTMDGLKKELQEIREQEFVQTLSEYHTVGFAVPVYKNTLVVASLSVFVPESRYTESYK